AISGDKLLKKRKSQSRSSQLGAKQTNADASDLDLKSSFEIAHIINAEDAKVAAAVKTALPQIGKAIDLITDAIAQGGRLIYVGAGTSGRIAALDAAECPPTFNVAPETVQFVMAGGPKALATAVEANEDSRRLGEREITKRKLQKHDVVVGIAASGRTPFTVAALGYVYGNLMVNVHLKNEKLVRRGVDILEQAAGVNSSRARKALNSAGNRVPVALVMLAANVNRRAAKRALKHANGHVRRAIALA